MRVNGKKQNHLFDNAVCKIGGVQYFIQVS
jgi:hypothetical protein